ncbi:MDR family MFS transporter [Thermopolyspora sp. NPDC052614]|uniref:MDR family MFS transporter n=1 Tax=Thermopolyspora sp. NPDC052614 TaxID=3155682 RepID=UPI00343B1BE0
MTETGIRPDVPTTAAAERRVYTHREVLEILSGLLLAMLTSMLSTSVVGTALPTIVGELGGQDQLSWVASANLLTMTVSVPLWGKLSDLFGRKRMFQLALVTFAGASVAAGMAQDMATLIAARAVQGMGAGGMMALVQVILGDVVEPRQRGRYNGYVGATFGISTVAGPLLGGLLVDAEGLGWRWCFYLAVPFAIVALLVVQRKLLLPRVKRDARIDWWGAFTITGSAASLMLVLSLGGHEFAWNSPQTFGLLGLSLVLLALAVLAERRAADPILPPRLFRDRTFVLSGAASHFVGITLFGMMIYLPQYLQIVKGMSPMNSGLMTLPMVLAHVTGSLVSGRLVTRFGRWKIYPTIGLLLVATGMALLSRLDAGSPHVLIGVEVAVLGTGFGLSMPTLLLAAQNAVERRDMAVATAGVAFFRSLGGAVGVAAFGALLTNLVHDEMTRLLAAAKLTLTGPVNLGTPEAIRDLAPAVRHIVVHSFAEAMSVVFLLAVPPALLGAIAVFFLRELPLRTSKSTSTS